MPSWILELTEGWNLPSDGLGVSVPEFRELESAWSAGDVALLIWLAARLAPSLPALRAVAVTTQVIVDKTIGLIPSQDLDVAGSLCERTRGAAPLDDESRWRRLLSQATICAEVAHCAAELAATGVRIARERDRDWEARSHTTPAQLASACAHARAARANYLCQVRGVFATSPDLDELVRARHVLRSDGFIVPTGSE